MKIPLSGRKKALLIVDVQPAFINSRNGYIVKNIAHLIKTTPYNFYVTALFHAEKGSLWDKQQNWICPQNDSFHALPEMMDLLKDKRHILIEKTTKSIFKGHGNIIQLLKKNNVQELHLVGFDTNDCVLASAYEAFDLGLFTYVIEECCESNSSAALHKQGLTLLRKQNMTNNSVVEKIPRRNI